ncbi:MAG: DNA methyltransferase [Rhizomicrobium sp.]
MGDSKDKNLVDAFIARWGGREGGQERANYAPFLSELCDVLGVARPDPAEATTEENDYVFERMVKDYNPDGSASSRRIDLYKRGCFVLEAKQSRQKGGAKEIVGQGDLLGGHPPQKRGARGATRAWDVLMFNARRQAEGYARALPVSHGWPPFILVCDVGHVIEVYADFSGQGKNYAQFPDRQNFRIYLDDLRIPAVRERLVSIWTEPLSLDPARKSARVTRQIAERLAEVSKALEKNKHPPEQVAMFLMRCLFTMFAEDVELLPKKSFQRLLERCEGDVSKFKPMVAQLWEAMDKGDFAYAIETQVKQFNGEFFKSRTVLPLERAEIGELRAAASHDWRDVDPSIFGTLLEQALNPDERRRLGAHYTPRAYVERLVVATVIEPLREEWNNVISTAERQKSEGRNDDAVASVSAFHEKLCKARVLDPACGTGNFLYVSLELVKRLEGEVLEALVDLGGQEALREFERHTVDPHQFLGLEINPRAAAIAELVLWIGHLQWYIRTKGGMPSEPILRAFHNIQVKDAVLTWDGAPVPKVVDGKETFPNARRPDWPEAEFIVGNPPFIGGKDIRARQGGDYAEALWKTHPDMNESADFVMYWWDRAAELLTRKATSLRRFGLVTTNSISQVFQRRVIERHLSAKKPISIIMAVPDHPWTKVSTDAAAVRIAMTVCEPGRREGTLHEISHEARLDTDTPIIEFSERTGLINSDLTIGVDVTITSSLLANEGICSPGVKLHGAGFIVTRPEAEHLGLGKRKGLENHIREYRNGRDLASRPRSKMVIDLYGLTVDEVKKKFPEVYQHIKLEVKEKIVVNEDGEKETVGRDWNNRQSYRDNWWIFGEPRSELRPALADIHRYIATVETTKHRVFQFLDKTILPDNMIVAIASDDAFILGTLSSRIHVIWTLYSGGTLEDRPRYTKTHCFDPFPFPNANKIQKQNIRIVADDIDTHRKTVLTDHPNLTLTGLYNVLELLRTGMPPDALDADDRLIFDDGLILILKELHERLDSAVADAYCWPTDLSDEEILGRLVALNNERAVEEAKGKVRWLRPDYQIPRFGKDKQKVELDLTGGEMRIAAPSAGPKGAFPSDDIAQTASVMAVLANASGGLDALAIAGTFKQGRRVTTKVASVLSALARMGFIDSPDGGRTFVLRRAA